MTAPTAWRWSSPTPSATAPLLPWVQDPEPAAAFLEASQPLWLADLELPSEPPPRPTAPMSPARIERLKAQSRAPVDPFEALLASKTVSANGLAPGAEPTVNEPNPLAAFEPWWGTQPPPSPPRGRRATIEAPVCTPPQWRTASRPAKAPRPSAPAPALLAEAEDPPRRRLRLGPVFAGLAVAAGVAVTLTLLVPKVSSASTDLVVPPPPPATEVVLAPERPAPAPAPAAASAPVRDSAKARLLKRARAAKKWAAETWPEVTVAPPAAEPAEEPEAPAEPPPAADELKRPTF